MNKYLLQAAAQQGTQLNYPSIVPTDLANLALWLTSDDVVDSSGKASQLTDLSGNNHHAVGAGVDNYPTITANALNGHNKITFNGVKNRLITDIFTVTQPYTFYIVSKFLASTPDRAQFGTPATPYSAFVYLLGGAPAGRLGAYAGAQPTIEDAYSTDLSCYVQVIRAATSEYYRNGIDKSHGTVGTQSITKGIQVGGYANSDAACANIDFYELIKLFFSDVYINRWTNLSSTFTTKVNFILS